jgi:hypothetical protein
MSFDILPVREIWFVPIMRCQIASVSGEALPDERFHTQVGLGYEIFCGEIGAG